MKISTMSVLALAALFALLAGCSESAPADETIGSATQTSSAAVETVFSEYEQIRAALVRDDASQVADAAGRIHDAAASVSTSTLSARMAEAASAAASLARADATDLPAVRRAFGELSRPLVALLNDDTSLAANRHVFECPMAEGYGLWIQPGAELQNPYMGSMQPSCGQEVP